MLGVFDQFTWDHDTCSSFALLAGCLLGAAIFFGALVRTVRSLLRR